MFESFEKIPVQIFETSQKGSLFAAQEIAKLIQQKQSLGQNCVLGLATGSTPIILYKELVRMHEQDGLSFKNVISFYCHFKIIWFIITIFLLITNILNHFLKIFQFKPKIPFIIYNL
jgi:hypothetical protein